MRCVVVWPLRGRLGRRARTKELGGVAVCGNERQGWTGLGQTLNARWASGHPRTFRSPGHRIRPLKTAVAASCVLVPHSTSLWVGEERGGTHPHPPLPLPFLGGDPAPMSRRGRGGQHRLEYSTPSALMNHEAQISNWSLVAPTQQTHIRECRRLQTGRCNSYTLQTEAHMFSS